MLNLNTILNLSGNKYRLAKQAKGIDVPPELISDQVKVILQVLVDELNKELQKLENNVFNLNKDVVDILNKKK